MTRLRLHLSLRRALALVVLAVPLLASRAGAVQLYIEDAFVHRNNANCVVIPKNGELEFMCPPIPSRITVFGTTTPPSVNQNVFSAPGVQSGKCLSADASTCTKFGFTAANNCWCGNDVTSSGPCEHDTQNNVSYPAPIAALGQTTAGDSCDHAGIDTVQNFQQYGNISNNPHIEFDQTFDASDIHPQNPNPQLSCADTLIQQPIGTGPLNPGSLYTNYCNANVFLCAAIGFGTSDTSAPTSIDSVEFEIFKFQDGSNPLDPGSTPPLRTFFVDAPGSLPGNNGDSGFSSGCVVGTSDACGPLGPFCVSFDGSVNIQGEFGKTNGQYGFRVTAMTNESGASGNIQITATRAYPSGATRDANPVCGSEGCIVPQQPISVDVTNVHVVRSSPSLVGTITAVPSEPYNIFYRLSKDATMYININDSTGNRVRSLLNGVTRVGEGTPNGTLSNGDSWNGRADNGDIAAPGNYLAVLQAVSVDQFGRDLSQAVTRQIGIDPLQITDIRVQPLLEGSTSLAVLDYILTEPATVYVDIYPPGTQFCNLSGNANSNDTTSGGVADDLTPGDPPKNFVPTLGGCSGVNPTTSTIPPIKRVVQQQPSRQRVVSFWDGRDLTGNVVGDGDYVFVMYAALPSKNGLVFGGGGGDPSDRRIWTSQAKSGFLPVSRGLVQISQVTPASSVIGSSPAIAGLNPFQFRYSLSRDAIVDMKIFDASGTNLIKTLVRHETRPGLFGNMEEWTDGANDQGQMVSSGTYLVQLTATDPLAPAKVSTTTALFPVDLYRITDVATTPLLSGASDLLTVSYQLSQPMNVWLNFYPPGTVINTTRGGGTSVWPPCVDTLGFPAPVCADVQTPTGGTAQPIVSIHGMRGGRLRITEQWDGRDNNGLIVPDGQYVFTLTAQSTTTPTYFPSDRISGTVMVQRGSIVFPTFNVVPDVPQLFNSSNTITLHPFSIDYSLTRQSSVTIQILNTSLPPTVIRNVVSGGVRQSGILLTDVWDGRDDNGNFPPSGFYIVRAVATDIATQLSSPSTAQVTISYDPLRIYDVAVSPVELGTGGATLFYQVSEPMKVAIKIYKPGTTFDTAGNPSPPESVSLVKRIIGVKPARTEIQDVWDGTDLRMSMVPDGSYKFKIVGSTDIHAIDNISGNVLNPGALAEDRVLDEIPVVRGASTDPKGDFENNTFVFPNPITTPQATFQIYVPFQGHVTMRLYNIAGQLVFDNDFGEVAPSFSSSGALQYTWNRVNASGRAVARGIYYAVIRAEETVGGKQVLQTTKKFLIP